MKTKTNKKTVTAKVVAVSYVPAKCPIRIVDNQDKSIVFVNRDTNFTVAHGEMKEVRMGVLGSGKYNVLALVFHTKRNKVNPRCVLNTVVNAKALKPTMEYIGRELLQRKVKCRICQEPEDMFDPEK